MIVAENESSYFVYNLYFLAGDSGKGITALENEIGLGHGYFSKTLKTGSSPTIRTAKRVSDTVGYTIDELIMKPRDFRLLVWRKNNA